MQKGNGNVPLELPFNFFLHAHKVDNVVSKYVVGQKRKLHRLSHWLIYLMSTKSIINMSVQRQLVYQLCLEL